MLLKISSGKRVAILSRPQYVNALSDLVCVGSVDSDRLRKLYFKKDNHISNASMYAELKLHAVKNRKYSSLPITVLEAQITKTLKGV